MGGGAYCREMQREMRPVCLWLVVVLLLGTRTTATAQSFSYAPLNTTLTVPFVLDTLSRTPAMLLEPETSEFIRDPFGDTSPPSGPPGITPTQRIAANTRLRYRMIGNPNIRSGGIRFTWFSMNSTVVGGSNDRVELQWFYGALSTQTGTLTSASNILVPPAGGNSLMWPGMVFTTITGPNIDPSSPTSMPDSESWGYVTEGVRVTGNGVTGDAVWPTLGVYDSAIGVTLANDDVVDTLVATTGHPISVVLRLPPQDVGSGVILWARCGAPPIESARDRKVWTNADGGAFFQMPPCTGGQTLHVSVTNTSNRPRAFRLYVGSHRENRESVGLKVGVAWNATTAEMNDIRTAMRRAAWQFYGLTGGAHVIRSYQYFHNAHYCDNGHPADEYACSGSGCQICLSPNTGRSNYNGLGKITLYANAGGDTARWMQGGNVIVHEFAHAYIGLPDEYVEVPTTFSGCAHTWMSTAVDNAFTLCTPASHRSTGLSYPFSRTHQGANNVTPAYVVYQTPDPRSNWQELWDDGVLVTQFPSGQTQEVIRMREFFSSSVIGRCDSGC